MLSDMWFVLNLGFPVYVLCLKIDKNTIFDIQIYASKYKKNNSMIDGKFYMGILLQLIKNQEVKGYSQSFFSAFSA